MYILPYILSLYNGKDSVEQQIGVAVMLKCINIMEGTAVFQGSGFGEQTADPSIHSFRPPPQPWITRPSMPFV